MRLFSADRHDASVGRSHARRYIGGMDRAFPVAALAAFLAVAPAAHAEQPAKPVAADALPGVDAKASGSVVDLKPVADDDKQAGADDDGWVRVGDWDVKMSGYVRMDIGTGLPHGGRD